jgi:hypothetical protein
MSARSFDLNKRRQGNITVNHDGMEFFEIVLHNTSVFTRYTDGTVILNSGGWNTTTTKTAMNRAFDLFRMNARVWQSNFQWKVTFNGVTTNFHDGMEVNGPMWRMLEKLALSK